MASVLPFPADEDRGVKPEVIPYDDKANKDFHDYLDNKYGNGEGVLVIEDVPLRPSLILHTMDPEGYRAALLEYQEEQTQELKELVMTRFPPPIAFALFQVERGYKHPDERFRLLKDVWESTIYVLYALVLGEFCASHRSMSGARLIKPTQEPALKFSDLFSDHVDMKLAVMAGLLRLASEQGYDLACRSLVSPDTIEKIRQLNGARNDFSHTAEKSYAQALDLFDTFYSEVLGILKDTRGLADVSFMRFESTGRSPFDCRFEFFVGSSLTHGRDDLRLEPDQFAKAHACLNTDTIVAKCGDAIFSVKPFIHFDQTYRGKHTKLCVYKQRKGEGASQAYVFEIVGESEELSLPGTTFAQQINDIQTLFAPKK